MKSARILLIASASLALGACLEIETDPTYEPDDTALAATSVSMTSSIAVRFTALQPSTIRIFCANGEPPYSLTVPICLPPRSGSCTAYYCPDPGGGRPTMASIVDRYGRQLPNPQCAYSQMQTTACSNDVELTEKAIPSPKQWHALMPHVFGDEMLDPKVTEPLE